MKLPFFFLADTWWFGATSRMPFSVFKLLVKKRVKQGFSAVQIVIGIPPETEVRGFAFRKDWSLDKKYFEEADKKIKYLVDNGLAPVIYGGWGHHIDVLGVEKIKSLWREIVARYSSYPVIWCLAGEIDMPNSHPVILSTFGKLSTGAVKDLMRFFSFGRAQDQNDNLRSRIKKWKEVGDYIHKIDPYKRQITAHVHRRTTALDLLGGRKWLSINSIQSGHSKDSVAFMVNSIINNDNSKMPIINMEPWYEGILGNFGEYEQRYAFWVCLLSGAKGHSYGAHGIWQMSKKGENFMGHWGDSYWKKSLKFRGAEQLGQSKKFLEKYEWRKLTACFENINPHWTEGNFYYPFAAKIEDKHIFIYVPKVGGIGEIGVKDLKNTTYNVSLISPESLKTIKSFKIKGKNCIIPLAKTRNLDLLLLVSKQ
ncbi:MAG: Alpha-L-rhamnosidase protein [uncultured bacterium]|nr:MAG: Alpha-L-rhamnosidase protein [uncultured bacterium]OGH13847.1 MAG: hypothetical protein A2687_04775 [Candidatus Levybacteria bacterium RIFCSPHIGHO2_01_FULL_38_26]